LCEKGKRRKKKKNDAHNATTAALQLLLPLAIVAIAHASRIAIADRRSALRRSPRAAAAARNKTKPLTHCRCRAALPK
jgi:hypothetical protein